MQLNMGEGKSSVIVPIVSAALADGKSLVRVIVAKPQAKQMFDMLVSKMGGLLDRRIVHMPFSRALRLGSAEVEAIHESLQEYVAAGGILLVQPKHILSFKLMAIERNILGDETVGNHMMRCQDFLHAWARDIVDESDENFSVKFELVYTMGVQRPIEASPQRWIAIQEILGIIRKCALAAKASSTDSMEMHRASAGCFPRFRFLRSSALDQLLLEVAVQICETGLTGFPIPMQPVSVRDAVKTSITRLDLTAAEISELEERGLRGVWSTSGNHILLLLRGLIAGGVLSFAFQKRWRVQYGLDSATPPRTKLAVPYRAKDNPTARSEFSHPEVVMVLTLLTYYYTGLTDDDLTLAFDHLRRSDQADQEYQVWVEDADNLPDAFRQLDGINLDDHFQCVDHVFPGLRYAKGAIDYFLAHLVFPKEMKEFPHKLSASGWDIGEEKQQKTTGFSGTNDARILLPLSVEQLDHEAQRHTNALVFGNILRPENTVVSVTSVCGGKTSKAQELLDLIVQMDPQVQVILDVGAQILELDNIGVAKSWLAMVRNRGDIQAVVYFDDDDRLCVIDRKGDIEPLATSALAAQLDACLVFLDEAHTRGTDLRLPRNHRAAVTLGANLTKDRLVQGM